MLAMHSFMHASRMPCVSQPAQSFQRMRLLDTALDDGWWAIPVPDRTTAGTASLNALDDSHRLLVASRDTAEDDVAAIEPRGDDSGDEELRAVGVGAGVGHGEEEGLVVGELEVLVGELFAVDGFAARALRTNDMLVR